jgi:hypothetical protein
MFSISDLSLRCIHQNNRLVAACHDGLILKTSNKPTQKDALWTVSYCSPSWTLANQGFPISVTFDTNRKLVHSSEECRLRSSEYLKVKDGDHRLLLRLSPGAVAAEGKRLGLELYTENDVNSQPSAVFFVQEESDQAFREVDLDLLINHPPPTETITELLNNSYDYFVIGSSFCSLAFIHQIFRNDSKAKILVLERGVKYLPEHHQQCPPSSLPGEVELIPWSISQETLKNEFIENVRGQIPLLGGRSTYWSGWSPTPSSKEMAGWPEQLRVPLENTYFALARGFLNVIAANKITAHESNRLLYRTFQNCLKNCLDSAASIESIDQVLHAPLAMGNDR